MRLWPDCDYFHEAQDDPFAPSDGDCESCYRYDICLGVYIRGLEEDNNGSDT